MSNSPCSGCDGHTISRDAWCNSPRSRGSICKSFPACVVPKCDHSFQQRCLVAHHSTKTQTLPDMSYQNFFHSLLFSKTCWVRVVSGSWFLRHPDKNHFDWAPNFAGRSGLLHFGTQDLRQQVVDFQQEDHIQDVPVRAMELLQWQCDSNCLNISLHGILTLVRECQTTAWVMSTANEVHQRVANKNTSEQF